MIKVIVPGLSTKSAKKHIVQHVSRKKLQMRQRLQETFGLDIEEQRHRAGNVSCKRQPPQTPPMSLIIIILLTVLMVLSS